MDVYEYVATSNPFIARNVIESFGYQLRSRDLASNLRELVSKEGEPALLKIMENHPDKEIILELFEKKEPVYKRHESTPDTAYLHYLNASGNSEATKYGLQTNTFLLASALILAVAIISKN